MHGFANGNPWKLFGNDYPIGHRRLSKTKTFRAENFYLIRKVKMKRQRKNSQDTFLLHKLVLWFRNE